MARMASHQVEKISRPVKVTRRVYDKETKKFADVTEEVTDGFMVYFPQGHSTFFKDEEALEEHGLTAKPKLVDLDGESEVVEENVHVLTPKTAVLNKMARRNAVGE